MKITHSNKKSWQLPQHEDVNNLYVDNCSTIIKYILVRRGFKTSSSISSFLFPKPLPEPNLHFSELDIAVRRLIKACRINEKVAICGDYDADGMTSTALLVNALNQMGCHAIPAIPNRLQEGYGLNERMINELDSKDIKLIITVDNGVTAFDAIKLANKLKINVILTDHHKITDNLPNVLSLIHPDNTPKDSPYRSMAGVGLAYVLAISVAKALKFKNVQKDILHLFSVGTIADMTPLVGANRYLVRLGLNDFINTNCKGLACLMKLSGIQERIITSDDISFQLAPRINAVGRIGNPQLIIRLLTELDEEIAMDIARECDELNRLRKQLCSGIEAEALALLEADYDQLPDFIIIAQNHWHTGVVGIVASRLVEKFNRPTALLTSDGKGMLRASVRSPNGFSVIKCLDSCSDLLENYGGHSAAGGFTIKPFNLANLQCRLNAIANERKNSALVTSQIKPDVLINFDEITLDLWTELQSLEPHGIENPKPLFWTRNCEVLEQKTLSGLHLKLRLQHTECIFDAIYWNYTFKDKLPKQIDIAFNINMNHWNNINTLQLEIKSIKPYKDIVSFTSSNKVYKCSVESRNIIRIENDKGEVLKYNYISNQLITENHFHLNNPYIVKLLNKTKIVLGIDK